MTYQELEDQALEVHVQAYERKAKLPRCLIKHGD